ncbi:V-type immunoglobulin domain-containing suppressor of T-cell activation [Varanus komodoensis]|nr:V-type immunoglobulin domain-containing suppressor of T-cell activation [Varanus komodoensis]
MDHPGRWWLLLQLTLTVAPREAQSTTLKITTPYALYICPEGQSVTLTCKVSASEHHGPIYRMWYFSDKRDQRCSEKQHIPGSMHKEPHHESGMHHGPPGSNSTAKKYLHGQQANHHGQASSNHHGIFHISMANLTLQHSGFYCCYVADVRREHGKDHVQQQAHSSIELRVQKGR